LRQSDKLVIHQTLGYLFATTTLPFCLVPFVLYVCIRLESPSLHSSFGVEKDALIFRKDLILVLLGF